MLGRTQVKLCSRYQVHAKGYTMLAPVVCPNSLVTELGRQMHQCIACFACVYIEIKMLSTSNIICGRDAPFVTF